MLCWHLSMPPPMPAVGSYGNKLYKGLEFSGWMWERWVACLVVNVLLRLVIKGC